MYSGVRNGTLFGAPRKENMKTSEALGVTPYQNSGAPDTLPHIRGMVRKGISLHLGASVSVVDMDAPIRNGSITPILHYVGSITDRVISQKLLPDKEWNGFKLAEFIFQNQESFPKDQAAQ